MAVLDPRQQQDTTNTNISGGSATNTGAAGTATIQDGQPAGAGGIAQTDPGKIVAANTGTDFSKLLQPFQAKTDSAVTNLNNAWNSFQSAAGAADPFDQTETSVLDKAITGTAADREAARNSVLNRSYSGPSGLGNGSWLTDLNGVNDVLSNTDNTDKLSSAFMQYTPTLSAGQARFDALLARQSPEFANQAGSIKSAVTNAITDANTKAQQASELAKSRADQAADVRAQATNYLGQKRNDLNNTITSALNSAKQQTEAPQAFDWTRYGVYNDADLNALRAKGLNTNTAMVATNQPTFNSVQTADQRAMQAAFADLLGDTTYTPNTETWNGPTFAENPALMSQMAAYATDAWNNTLNNTHRTRMQSAMGHSGDDFLNWVMADPSRERDWIARTLDHASGVNAYNAIANDPAKVAQAMAASSPNGTNNEDWAAYLNADPTWSRWHQFNEAVRQAKG